MSNEATDNRDIADGGADPADSTHSPESEHPTGSAQPPELEHSPEPEHTQKPGHRPSSLPGPGSHETAAVNLAASHNNAASSTTDAADHTGPDSALVRVERLTKDYRSTRALDGLSLTLPAGRIVGLMGDNGAGKTTLLKILAGVVADYEGEVTIGGHRPGPESKAIVSFLPDRNFLDANLTAAKAIDLYSRFFADFDAAKAREMVRFFKLPEDRPLKTMSKGTGEKLRVALVMSRKARVYLLDEPISGVDPAARDVILNGVLGDFDPGALMIISTHLIAEVEAIVDSVVFLRDGRLLLTGDADDLREQHDSSLDALFRKEYR